MTKVGDIFLQVGDDEYGKISWDEYHVRTIRKGRVYATLKASFTWGKVSSKSGDFGWLDPTPSWCRKSWPDAQVPEVDLATTRIGALKKAIASHIKYAHADDYTDPATYLKTLATMKKMLVREQNKVRAKRTATKRKLEIPSNTETGDYNARDYR